MANVSAQKSRVFAGSLNWSGYTRSFGLSDTVDALEVTTLVDTAKAFIVGQNTSTATFDILLDTDTTAGGEWSAGTTWKTTQPTALAYAPSGTTLGSEVLLADSLLTSFTTTSTPSGAVSGSLATQTTGPTEAGQVVGDLTAITIDGNGTAVDGGAATANGGVAQIHVTAFSGLTNNIVTIEHSVDGSTAWATLATFATYTGLTSERVVVAPATTVRRYLRVVDNVTGTGSTVRAVLFARR
jgi:hypothetical protein